MFQHNTDIEIMHKIVSNPIPSSSYINRNILPLIAGNFVTLCGMKWIPDLPRHSVKTFYMCDEASLYDHRLAAARDNITDKDMLRMNYNIPKHWGIFNKVIISMENIDFVATVRTRRRNGNASGM